MGGAACGLDDEEEDEEDDDGDDGLWGVAAGTSAAVFCQSWMGLGVAWLRIWVGEIWRRG